MKKRIRVARRQFVRGLSSLLEISEIAPRRKLPTAAEALRKDMERIGADMYRVVDRERAREKTSRKALESAK